jgi:hypothetical protein
MTVDASAPWAESETIGRAFGVVVPHGIAAERLWRTATVARRRGDRWILVGSSQAYSDHSTATASPPATDASSTEVSTAS